MNKSEELIDHVKEKLAKSPKLLTTMSEAISHFENAEQKPVELILFVDEQDTVTADWESIQQAVIEYRNESFARMQTTRQKEFEEKVARQRAEQIAKFGNGDDTK